MLSLKDELHYFIDSYHAGIPLVTPDALEQLAHHGDRLVPGLIELLSDDDPDVREFAVDLLAEIRPRPRAAVPALIERLSDPETLVRLAVVNMIGDFGHFAKEAIPVLEPLLSSPDEYQRTLAAKTILQIDRSRTELMPIINAALSTEQPNTRLLAREFCRQTDCTLEFDEADLLTAVKRCWRYRAMSEQLHWSSHMQDDGVLEIDAAPVYQEVFGGENDGKVTWADFEFDTLGFSNEVDCTEIVALGESEEHSLKSLVGIRGSLNGQRFLLRLHLSPIENTVIREIYDSINNTVRPKS